MKSRKDIILRRPHHMTSSMHIASLISMISLVRIASSWIFMLVFALKHLRQIAVLVGRVLGGGGSTRRQRTRFRGVGVTGTRGNAPGAAAHSAGIASAAYGARGGGSGAVGHAPVEVHAAMAWVASGSLRRQHVGHQRTDQLEYLADGYHRYTHP